MANLEYYNTFFVIGENSERRIISSPQSSPEEAEEWIIRAEALDKKRKESFNYDISHVIKRKKRG